MAWLLLILRDLVEGLAQKLEERTQEKETASIYL